MAGPAATMTSPETGSDKARLRKMLRARRRALSAGEQRRAGASLARRLAGQPLWRRSRRIAVYWACDGEIDPRPLVEQAWQQGRQVFLPVVDWLNPRLRFVGWDRQTPLISNRYGIAEPAPSGDRCPVAPWTLDLVLVPLTGFDAACHRLGMGGGFYDRTFCSSRAGMAIRQPPLLGLAHSCQQLEQVPTDPHDLALSAVATDRAVLTATGA